MEKMATKKHIPYLYSFKMKPDTPHLYSCKKKSPLDKLLYHKEQLIRIGMINETATNTVFQPSMIQALNIVDHVAKDTKEDSFFQTKPNLAEPSTMFSEMSTVFVMPKTTTATFERPNIAAFTFERPQPVNLPHNGSYPCIKSTDEALEIPMLLSLRSSEPNLTIMPGIRPMYTAFQRPVSDLEKLNVMYLDFKRPDAREKPMPKEVNWTLIDLAPKKVDMIPTWTKVVMGVACSMIATAVVHPPDVVKVRLQLYPRKVSTLRMLERILACEGPRGLYTGLTAGMLRQLTYTGTRLTVYHSLYANYWETHGKYPDFNERMRIAVVAGLAGAFMGVPSEVLLVRMIEMRHLQRSRCSPPCSAACKYVQRPEGAIKQLLRVARREGVATWWRGAVPTLVRSIFVTSAQVGVYTEIRQALTKGDYEFTGPFLLFYTACISSLVSTILSLPVDQVKTRCQSYQERHCHGRDILKEMLRKKGVRYLWKGFLPYYVRQVAHTTITNVMLDQLIYVYTYVDYQEASN